MRSKQEILILLAIILTAFTSTGANNRVRDVYIPEPWSNYENVEENTSGLKQYGKIQRFKKNLKKGTESFSLYKSKI